MTLTEAAVILYRGDHERHHTILAQALRAAEDSGVTPLWLAPQGTALPDTHRNDVRCYDPATPIATLAAAVRAATGSQKVKQVFALAEQDVYRAALLRREFGCPGLDPAETIYFRDKNAMTARVAELGIPVADSCQPHTLTTVRSFAARVGYPIVAKPFDGVSCTDTYKISNADELDNLWPAIGERRHDYRVEAFVQGRQFHLDTIVRDGQVLFDAIAEYGANILETVGHSPIHSVLHQQTDHQQMVDAHHLLLRELGLSTGIAHTEFFLRPDGTAVFGETAARMAGGYIPMMYHGAFGLDLAYNWIRTELDPTYMPEPTEQRKVASSYLWTEACGVVRFITSQQQLREIPGVLDATVWAVPGDRIQTGAGSRGQDIGFITVAGATSEELERNLATAHRSFAVACT